MARKGVRRIKRGATQAARAGRQDARVARKLAGEQETNAARRKFEADARIREEQAAQTEAYAEEKARHFGEQAAEQLRQGEGIKDVREKAIEMSPRERRRLERQARARENQERTSRANAAGRAKDFGKEATGDPATRGGAVLRAHALAEVLFAEALAASGAPHPEDPAEILRILEQ
jgi:hypothetical protein